MRTWPSGAALRFAAPARAALAVAAFVLTSAALAASPEHPDGLRPPLAGVLDRAAPGELVPVTVVLAEQADARTLLELKRGRTTATARAAVIEHLKQLSARSRTGLMARLSVAQRGGAAARVTPLWIGNVVALEATPALIREIARRPEVAWVNHNPKVNAFLGEPVCAELSTPLAGTAAMSSATPVECGVDMMRAPRAWDDLKRTGTGVVVAVIDTGVCRTHPDIARHIWVNPGEDLDHDGVVMDPDDMNGIDDDGDGFVDDLVGWDWAYADNDPSDDHGHGSHTAGSVAGDGTSGLHIGVAPGATVMTLKVGVEFTDEAQVWAAMQYAVEHGAAVISMSLGWPHDENPDRATWRTNVENAIEAGTTMVVAAGNEGSGNEPDNVRTPGDVPRLIGVGATTCADAIAGFSSRGPVTWQDVSPFNDFPWPPGLVKPDVSAPGEATMSSALCSGYAQMSGTSMATPHVAGAVALMLSAEPGLAPDEIKSILQQTAVDLGPAGSDNEFGAGRVDAYEAVLAANGSNGLAAITSTDVSCGATIELSVSDKDLRGTGTLPVRVISTSDPQGQPVVLVESSVGSGRFDGEVALGPGGTNSVQVADGDTITLTYVDASDGLGGTSVAKYDTAVADCAGPVIENLAHEAITATSFTLRFTTSEPAYGTVEYGPTAALGQVVHLAGLNTQHVLTLTRFEICNTVYLRLSASDRNGNASVEPLLHRVQTARIPGLYWRTGFETGSAGWTLQGEWEIGKPQGKGSINWCGPDPTEAFANDNVLGMDLTGRGANPGDYEPTVSWNARMPAQDARTWARTKLIMNDWNNAEDGDKSEIWLNAGGTWRRVYTSFGLRSGVNWWTNWFWDVSSWADGRASVFLEFRFSSDASSQASGWNIDEVIFKDGALPDYDACGGCAMPPDFAGATAARDVDACGKSGVTVTWPAASAWGSAWSGTYAVYRGSAPGFTPSAATLVASGLTGTSYTDLAAPADTQQYWLVRAENAETCGGGPNNGGAVDANTRYVSAADATATPGAGAIGDLALTLAGRVHVNLAWSAAAGAADYEVLRSASPLSADFGPLASSTATLYEDLGAGADGASWFYLVQPRNACGSATP